MNILNLISIRDLIAFLSFAFFYQEPLKLLQKKSSLLAPPSTSLENILYPGKSHLFRKVVFLRKHGFIFFF